MFDLVSRQKYALSQSLGALYLDVSGSALHALIIVRLGTGLILNVLISPTLKLLLRPFHRVRFNRSPYVGIRPETFRLLLGDCCRVFRVAFKYGMRKQISLVVAADVGYGLVHPRV